MTRRWMAIVAMLGAATAGSLPARAQESVPQDDEALLPAPAPEKAPDATVGESPQKKARHGLPPGVHRAQFQVSMLGIGAAGANTPGFVAGGGAGFEWGARWYVGSKVRMGLRNTWHLVALPWDNVDTYDGDDEDASEGNAIVGTRPGHDTKWHASLLSGLYWSIESRLSPDILLDVSLGPAFLAAEPKGWSGILCLPSAGLALEFDLVHGPKADLRLRLGADVVLHPADDDYDLAAVFTPHAGLTWVF